MNPAAVPTPLEDVQGDGRWLSMHNRFVSQARELEPEVVFVGDSLITNLHSSDIWETWFAKFHSLNFGIGGDQTQHVLWRLKNGELDHLSPKVVVVLCGTNNHSNSASEVAGGITEICNVIREKQPDTHILALTLLPRGEKPNPLREKISQINALMKESIRQIPQCQVVPIGQDLILADGTIDHRDMYDYLHLTWQGYRKVFEPVYELLQQLIHDERDTSLINDSSLNSPQGDNPVPVTQ